MVCQTIYNINFFSRVLSILSPLCRLEMKYRVFTAIDSDVLVNSHPLDWSLLPTTADIFSTPFDVIFGADIVYDAQHAS